MSSTAAISRWPPPGADPAAVSVYSTFLIRGYLRRVLIVEFYPAGDRLVDADRTVIAGLAADAEADVRALLPMADPLHLLVCASTAVLAATGDNASTQEPDRITWLVDPRRGAADVAAAHLRKALFHEAYHAARFRRLRQEAGTRLWLHVALGEGLATVFARDFADAHEPWSAYDPAVIAGWAAELARQGPADDLRAYKFRHGDGREWIAFRVGTWLVDGIVQRTGQSAADLVWTPAEELVELCDLPQHRWRGEVHG